MGNGGKRQVQAVQGHPLLRAATPIPSSKAYHFPETPRPVMLTSDVRKNGFLVEPRRGRGRGADP